VDRTLYDERLRDYLFPSHFIVTVALPSIIAAILLVGGITAIICSFRMRDA
jgi:hypothetical protein